MTSRNQGLSLNDKGRQRRESLGTRLSANQRALMLMSMMSSLNISISISIRKELMLMSQLSSLAHKLLMLMFMLMLASLVRTGLN